MKKFFALFIVIALLAVTGSAFAADPVPPTVSLSTSLVTITREQAFAGATITITATPQNRGDITDYALDGSAYDASLSGRIVTIPGMTAEETNALTAGSTSFTVTATETYITRNDSGGHVTATINGTATFVVTVLDPAPTPTPDPDSGTSSSETPTVNEHQDSITLGAYVINVESVTNPTPEEVGQPQIATIRIYVQNDEGGNSGREILINVINFENFLQHANENVVEAIFNIFFSSSVNTFAGNSFTAAADTDIQVQDNSKLTVTESGKTTAEEVREASAYLQNAGNELTAVTVLPTMSTDTTGVYLFALPFFDEAFYGMTVTGFSNVDEYGVEKGANVFLNAQADSTCAVTTTIPGLETSADILPGFLTFAVYMQAGKTYRPVVAVPITSVQEVPGLGSTETVTVATRFTEVKTSTFTNYFDESLLAGREYKRIPGSLISREGWKDTAAEAAAKEANANYNIFTLVAFPAINGPDAETWYLAKVSFDKYTKTAADLYNNAGLTFYPDNVLEDADSTTRFFKEENGALAALTASEIFGSSSRYTQGYVAFKLAALTGATKPAVTTNVVKSTSTEFEIYASSYEVTFAGPNSAAQDIQLTSNYIGDVTYTAIVDKTSGLTAVVDDDDDVLTLEPSAAGTYVVTVTGTNGTDTDTLEINVTVNRRMGSSGGGCSAGFSALALAVLGAFIARRRK